MPERAPSPAKRRRSHPRLPGSAEPARRPGRSGLSTAPDLVEPVVGFRAWRLVGGQRRAAVEGAAAALEVPSCRGQSSRRHEAPLPGGMLPGSWLGRAPIVGKGGSDDRRTRPTHGP